MIPGTNLKAAILLRSWPGQNLAGDQAAVKVGN